MGRPTKYTEETVSEILVQIMMGRSLTEICRTEKWAPSKKTVIRWLHRYREFRHRYARAREIQVHSIMDEVPGMIRGGFVSERYMKELESHLNRLAPKKRWESF